MYAYPSDVTCRQGLGSGGQGTDTHSRTNARVRAVRARAHTHTHTRKRTWLSSKGMRVPTTMPSTTRSKTCEPQSKIMFTQYQRCAQNFVRTCVSEYVTFARLCWTSEDGFQGRREEGERQVERHGQRIPGLNLGL